MMRHAQPALTVMRDYDSGAHAAQWAESRRAMAGGTLSARCKRLEENMLLNLSTMQNHRRGLEDVVQRRKEKAMRVQQEMREGMKAMQGGKVSGGDILGIAPLNFTTLRERTAAIEETVGRNQDTLMSNRSMLDRISAAKKDASQAEETDRTLLPEEERASLSGTGGASPADRLDVIEANACMIREKLQPRAADSSLVEEDVTQLKADSMEQYELDVKAQAEVRQYILFGRNPQTAAATHIKRPQSAPAGARSVPSRPGSSYGSYGRPQSAASGPARPGTAGRPGSALSGRSASVLGVPSRPCSANSMRARMKVMEENVARNKKILTTNRDGIEVVKKRRAEAASAMTQLLVDLKAEKDS